MSETQAKLSPKQKVQKALSVIISRSVGERAVVTNDLKITENLVTGNVRTQSKKLGFSCAINPNDTLTVYYSEPKAKGERRDRAPAVINGGIRFDAKRPVCKEGTLCGDTCIEKGDVCRVNDGYLPPKETVVKLKEAVAEAAIDDKYSKMTIRELKERARVEGVYKYSNLKSEELRQNLRFGEQNPEERERLFKTLDKRRQRESAIAKVLPKKLGKTFRTLAQISRTAGISPEKAAILAGAALVGMTIDQYKNSRDRYKDGLDNAAAIAMDRARNIPTRRINKDGMLFAVGGFRNNGGDAKQISAALRKPIDNSKGEKWLGNNQEIIEVNHPSMGMPKASGALRVPAILSGGMGRNMKNLTRNQNDASIDLAARFYAYGVKNPRKPINVLAHGYGGINTRAAGEVLRRMKPRNGKGMTGQDVFDRMNVVALGSPYFGYTNDKAWDKIPYRTITSGKDAFSFLPKKMAEWVDSVNGDTADEYLKNPEVRDRLRETFGFYQTSLAQQELNAGKRKEFVGEVRESLRIVSPSMARNWDTLSGIVEKSRSNPIAAGIVATAAIGGGTVDQIRRAQKRYQRNLSESALEADVLANSMVDSIQSNKVTGRKKAVQIAVGGNEMTAEELTAEISKGTGLNKTQTDFLAKKQIHVNFDVTSAGRELPDDIKEGSIAHAGFVLNRFYQKTLGQYDKVGKTNDAIRLAATIRAQAMREHELTTTDGAAVVTHPINVVAYGQGGLVAREAMDILRRLDKSKRTNFASQVHLTTLGTPSFHVADGSHPEKNIMGSGDYWGKGPFTRGKGRTEYVSGVSAHSAEQYLQNPDVIRRIHDQASSALDSRGNLTKIKTTVAGRGLTPNQAKYAAMSNAPKRPEQLYTTEQWNALSAQDKRKAGDRYVKDLKLFIDKIREEQRSQSIVEQAEQAFADKPKNPRKKKGKGDRTDSHDVAFWFGYYKAKELTETGALR